MKAHVTGDAWLSNEDSDEYWAEGAKARIEVENTDADEVRVGIVLDGEESEAAGFYVSRQSADQLARYLFAASVAPVELHAV